MKKKTQASVFGRRKEPHTVIIARGDQLKHFTIRPWLVASVGAVCATLALGYLVATTYLVLRDDLIGASIARQARMQQAYEDRISALRAQVDRITSRQLLDQQLVETKVSELLQRQSELTARHKSLEPLLDDTQDARTPAPIPTARPDERAELDPLATGSTGLAFASADPGAHLSLWSENAGNQSEADRADMMFSSISKSLSSIEAEQVNKLDSLTDHAYQTAEKIDDALNDAGVQVSLAKGKAEEDVGGPLLPPVGGDAAFDGKVKELDAALDKLGALKSAALRIPIANPGHDWTVTSPFGNRSDPFLNSAAFHPGMDFRAPIGAPINVAAPGVVTRADWAGGYGRMVEVDHGNGFVTRYGHMSQIVASVGQKVKTGDLIGYVGSSGRSTGPHLHYEVRKNGVAVDPSTFIKAGKRIAAALATQQN